MAATPVKRSAVAHFARGNSTSGTQLMTMFMIAGGVFLLGIFIGAQVFDHRTAPDESRPWSAFTHQKLRVPPGMTTRKVPKVNVDTVPSGEEMPTSPSVAAPAAALENDWSKNFPSDLTAIRANGPSSFIDFSGKGGLELNSSIDSPLVSFAAWIYLDSRDKFGSIKMIASNRNGGCAVDDKHRGWSFYINHWQTSDRALVLEWRNQAKPDDGCARLESEPNTIPLDEWTHVGFALSSTASNAPQHALLFLNGELLRAAKVSRNAEDVQQDEVGGTNPHLTIGGSPDGQFPFSGRIGQVVVANTLVKPSQLLAIAGAGDAAALVRLSSAAPTEIKAIFSLSSETFQCEGMAVSSSRSGHFVGDATRRHVAADAYQSLPVSLEALPAVVGTPPLNRKAPVPLKDSSSGDKTPASIRRGPISGTLPEDAVADFTKGGNQWVQHMIAIPDDKVTGSVQDKHALASGLFSDAVTVQQLVESDNLGRHRAQSVKAAMRYAWQSYRKQAWGADELKPRSGTGQDNWGGVGMTLVDSLDTLWLMGMMTEFDEAKEWVKQSLSFDKHSSISVFEITIRELGGLLSAYDLSGDAIFLAKAKELADNLLPAFNTPTGIPRSSIVLSTGQSSSAGWTGGSAILAELGTLQVEFRRLAKATGSATYARKAEQVIEKLEGVKPPHGLYPIYISTESGQPTTTQITFGALGDSFYEYLLKVWVQGGRKEPMYRRMYDTAMQGLTDVLLKKSTPSSLLYVADYDGGNTVDKMDHLVCFVPGMLALGAFTSAGTAGEAHAMRDLQNAKAIMYTCWQMYERMSTGISPEFVDFPNGRDLAASERAPFYILRPEAAESLYILHQLTGNPIYREWGWKMFEAIDRHCKVQFGYGAHPDVRDTTRTPDDRMESFFLAETLKYLYLLQSPDHPISLERYVFNTEAHPVRIFTEL